MAFSGFSYWSSLRSNLRDLIGEQLFAAGPEVILAGIDMLASGRPVSIDVANRTVALIIIVNQSDAILYKQDRQETIAELIGLFFPDRKIRQRVSRFSEEFVEAVVRIQTTFRHHPLSNDAQRRPMQDPEVTEFNRSIALDVLKGTHRAEGDPMVQPKQNQNPPAGAQPAAAAPVAASVVVAAPKPPTPVTHNVIHLVGTLNEGDAKTFWETVGLVQQELNAAQDAELARHGRALQPGERRASTEVAQLINRVTLTQEQLKGILHAPTPELRREALLQALRQAPSVGGTGSGLGRLLDHAIGMVEAAFPRGASTDNPLADMRVNNTRRQAEDDEVAGIR